MPVFRIVFSGLCVFVPRGGSFDEPRNQPNEVIVLLPNAIEPCVLPDVDQILAPHFPLLVFNRRNLSLTDDQPPFLAFHQPGERSDRGANLLFRRDLRISIDGEAPVPKMVVGSHPPNTGPTGPGSPGDPSDEDIDRLLHFECVAGSPCIIQPDLLDDLKSSELRIIARIQITTGTLRVFELEDEGWRLEERCKLAGVLHPKDGAKEDRTCCECYPDLLCCDQPRAEGLDAGPAVKYLTLATKIALELDFDQEVAIISHRFGGKDPRRLVFVPRTDRPQDDVEIEIRNLEPNDLLGVPEKIPLPYTIDPDYSIYYKVIKLYPGKEKPEPKLLLKSRFFSGGGYGKPCTPTRILEELPASSSASSRHLTVDATPEQTESKDPSARAGKRLPQPRGRRARK